MPLQNVQLGAEAVLIHPDLVNLYECSIGDGAEIGSFVEIQKNSHVGACREISSPSFVCEGVPAKAVGDFREREDLSTQVTEMAAP